MPRAAPIAIPLSQKAARFIWLRAPGLASLDSACHFDAKSKPLPRKAIAPGMRRGLLLPVAINIFSAPRID